MRLLLTLLLTIITLFVFSQTFTNTTNVAIPDCGSTVNSIINVSGLGTSIDCSTLGLQSVCIKINHTWDSDLDIFLVAPDLTIIELSTDNGSSGNNYGNGSNTDNGVYTCFDMTGLAGSVTSGTAPFQNVYIPEGNLGTANNGQNPNGNWQLRVTDDACADVGFINSWSLTFATTNLPCPPPPPSLCYTVSQIAYNPIAPGGTSVAMTDDAVTGPLPIGFTFCFGGVNYTNFYIGSNGWVGFTPGQPTTYTSMPIPNAGASIPKNCIAGPWQDWNPGIAGGPYITYQTLGLSPNRTLVVTWFNCPFYSCTTVTGSFQIVLYETSNLIDNTLANKPACLTWAGGTAVQGLHDITGTLAVTVLGRNSTQWTATNETWRYTPNCAPCAVVLPIELLNFEGYNKDNVNRLSWSTSSEINNDFFTIERSVDGENWLKIEEIDGAGNSNIERFYEYNDNSYSNQINYYRLTQTDFNGKSESFNIIAINNKYLSIGEAVKVINLLGQDVDKDYTGMRILIYEDGIRVKKIGK